MRAFLPKKVIRCTDSELATLDWLKKIVSSYYYYFFEQCGEYFFSQEGENEAEKY